MTAVRKEEETKEMGKIIGICISEKRGTAKHEVETAKLVEDWGIEGDAHAGHWHRQVSLLSYEKIEAFRAKGADIPLGAFGDKGKNRVLSLFQLCKQFPVKFVHVSSPCV